LPWLMSIFLRKRSKQRKSRRTPRRKRNNLIQLVMTRKTYPLLKILPKLSNFLVRERLEREGLPRISYLNLTMMMRFPCLIIATWKKGGLLRGVHLGVFQSA
jgi:hypothetical protein